jgi:hypothetical protein
MPATTPPARYDLPWKAALTHAFRAFMAFFFGELCAQIDWSKRPLFRDKELAGIMSGDAPDWRPNAFHNQLLGTKGGFRSLPPSCWAMRPVRIWSPRKIRLPW